MHKTGGFIRFNGTRDYEWKQYKSYHNFCATLIQAILTSSMSQLLSCVLYKAEVTKCLKSLSASRNTAAWPISESKRWNCFCLYPAQTDNIHLVNSKPLNFKGSEWLKMSTIIHLFVSNMYAIQIVPKTFFTPNCNSFEIIAAEVPFLLWKF